MRTRLLALAVALVLGITGTVVLVRYMQGADARALAGTRTVTVLMVRAPIPVGTPADELSGYVALTAVPELAAVGGRVADLSELAGMESVVPLVAGEQLLPHHFSAPGEGAAIAATVPDGFQQFTVMLQSQRALGGAIAAGDRVGMFLSFAPPLANHTTNLRLESVLVTSVRSASAVPGADSGDATHQPAGRPNWRRPGRPSPRPPPRRASSCTSRSPPTPPTPRWSSSPRSTEPSGCPRHRSAPAGPAPGPSPPPTSTAPHRVEAPREPADRGQ